MRRLVEVLVQVSILIGGMSVTSWSLALDFQQAYRLALQHDPQWLASRSESATDEHERTLGRAALLPNLSYRYSRARNRSEVEQSTALGNSTQRLDYTSYSSGFTLTQPLFDAAAWAQYQSGKAHAEAARYTLERARQALAVRVLQAYTDVLYAGNGLELAETHGRALAEQAARSRRFVELGEGTHTDELEIKAQARIIEAQRIEAENQLYDARNALRALIGNGVDGELQPLREDALDDLPDPGALDAWRRRLLADNPELAAQRRELEAARQQRNRERAGHLPSVRLFARSQISESNSENQIGQHYDTDSLGFEINLPLYAGGRVVAASRQASDRLEQARHELDVTTNDLLNDLERQYRLVVSSRQRIAAYHDAAVAAEARLKATGHSLAGGERTNLDLLDAEWQMFSARRDLARARYDYLLAWLSLRWQAGSLDEREIATLASRFGPPIASGPGSRAPFHGG